MVQPGVTSEPLPEMPNAPPSDPGFGSQWGLAKIRAPEAWEITAGSSGISVAIIDEGCDMVHEDVAYDGDSDPSPAFPQDAHGTACAGVAAARAGNGKGGAGVAPGCRIVPIRIAQGIPGSPYWSTDSGKVASGIRKAVDLGADVLSNSYRVGPSNAVLSALRYAQTNGRGGKGSLIAAAAGNGDVRGLIYPARLSSAIPGFLAVGASNEWDQRKSKTSLDGESWWGSNWGPELDCVAPGVHVYTTDITGTAGYGSGNYVPNFNGTSSATPHAAGVAALVISVDPELRSWEVEEIIKLSAKGAGSGRPRRGVRPWARRCPGRARGRLQDLVRDPRRAGLPRLGTRVLHAGDHPDVQPRDQSRAARLADAQLAHARLDTRDRSVRIPAEPGQPARAALQSRHTAEQHPAARDRYEQLLELPLAPRLVVHVLAPGGPGSSARGQRSWRGTLDNELGRTRRVELRRGGA